MMRCDQSRFRLAYLACLVVLCAAKLAVAQENQKGFTEWLNEEIATNVQVAVGSRSTSNQVEAPTAASTSTSLVDTSSASDLIGVALNLADLSAASGQASGQKKATSTSATVSAYALYAAFSSKSPLDPSLYCPPRNASVRPWENPENWRSVSFTVGLDDKSGDPASGSTRDPIIAGVKWQAINGRDVCDSGANGEFAGVLAALQSATEKFGGLQGRVIDELFTQFVRETDKPSDLVEKFASERELIVQRGKEAEIASAKARGETLKPEDAWPRRFKKMVDARLKDPTLTRVQAEALVNDRLNHEAFENMVENGETLDKVLSAVKSDRKSFLAKFLGPSDIASFVALSEATNQAVEDFRKKPQLSFSFLSKVREQGSDEYSAQAILDIGLWRRLNLTANASYEAKENFMAKDEQGGRIATQLQFQPSADPLTGAKPLRASLGFEATAMTHVGPTYTGQLKINLPIPKIAALSGLELPLSLTIANRSDLVHETELRGIVGFTIDTSQVLATLEGR